MSGVLPVSARAARDLARSWLAHRPVDRRGFVVPWINRWGAETLAATRIGWDPWVKGPALFHDDHGDTPDFTAQHPGRQREAVLRGLCQVCGRAVPWSRRNLVLSGSTVEAVDAGGARPVMTVIEPWLDDRCAAIATLLCPALIRRGHDEDLHVVGVRREKDVRILLSVGRIDAGLLRQAATAQPGHVQRLRQASERGVYAMWAKIVLLRHPIAYREHRQAPADDPAGAVQAL